MPQASDELQGLMKTWFGDYVDDQGPMRFLYSHGYELTKGWQWKLPVPHHSVSCYEWICIVFLVQEWDFGAIADDPGGPTKCLCGNNTHRRYE